MTLYSELCQRNQTLPLVQETGSRIHKWYQKSSLTPPFRPFQTTSLLHPCTRNLLLLTAQRYLKDLVLVKMAIALAALRRHICLCNYLCYNPSAGLFKIPVNSVEMVNF